MDWTAIGVVVAVATPVSAAGFSAWVYNRGIEAAKGVQHERSEIEESFRDADDRIRKIAREETEALRRGIGAEVRAALAEFKAELPELLNTPTGYRRKTECDLIVGITRNQVETLSRDFVHIKKMSEDVRSTNQTILSRLKRLESEA